MQDWDNNANKVYDFRPQSDSIFPDDVCSQFNSAIGGAATSLQLGEVINIVPPPPLGLGVVRGGSSEE